MLLQVALLLARHGARLDAEDSEGLSPLTLCSTPTQRQALQQAALG